MAHALFWPSKATFHPLGDTPAVSLTQDLTPETSVDILLLGCGDPRHILFTLFADVTSSNLRKIDITCCDIECAVLARNVLLFTLLDDNEEIDRIWDVFYHFKINKKSFDLLVRQSQKLYDCAETIESWRQSSYGSFLKFLDTRTLAELRRLWRNYANFSTIPSDRLNKILGEQSKLSKSILNKHGDNILPARAAGVFCIEAIEPVNSLYRKYWKTGTILAPDEATELNPTFVYSNSGESFNLDYSTFPQGFHLAPAMAPTLPSFEQQTQSAVTNLMKRQFSDWVRAFQTSRAAKSITLRFYVGDALAFCQALDLYSQTGQTVPGLYVSEWHAAQIMLDSIELSIPTSFDAIETSNLVDHLDFHNLLFASRPLMKPHAILYTESLLSALRHGIERSILDNRIHTSIPTLASVVGVAPRHYISGFTSRPPNAHEDRLAQTQERIAWVDPCSGDTQVAKHPPVVEFDPETLATALFGLYDKMFYREQQLMSVIGASFSYAMPLHYTRWTVGSLFRIVKQRVKSDWFKVGEKFVELVDKARNYVIGSQYVHDVKFWLYLTGIYTDPSIVRTPFPTNSAIFREWEDVPPVVCVTMTVPRKHLKALLENRDQTGIPQLEIALKSFRPTGTKRGYTNLHCVWGKLVGSSSPDSQDTRLEEDFAGFAGSSDLIVSFLASSHIVGEPDVAIAFALKTSTHSEAVFKDKTASGLVLFAAGVEDRAFVRVLRYRPSDTSKVELVKLPPITSPANGCSTKVFPTLGAGPAERHVVSFTGRLDVQSQVEQEALTGGAEVQANQISPCAMLLRVGKFEHTLTYPYPVSGENVKLKIVRKLGYIEVIVPPSDATNGGGYGLNPTPVVQKSPWNIHRIAIDRMPQLDTTDPARMNWIVAHTTTQLSKSEQELMLSTSTTKPSSFAAWVAARDTLGTVIGSCTDPGAIRVVVLSESEGGAACIVLLIRGLALDLASNAVVCDAAVVHPAAPLLPAILSKQPTAERLELVKSGDEIVAWKKMIPAFVERCRTWSHGVNCEYAANDKVPVSTEPDASPICTCGQGVGLDAFNSGDNTLADLLPFATRLAISPLFHAGPPSIPGNFISGRLGGTGPRWEYRPRTDKSCWVCYGAGKPNLLTCSRCKTARYCSSDCQKQDWKSHKKTCKN